MIVVFQPRITFDTSPKKMKALFQEPVSSVFRRLRATDTRQLTAPEAVSMLSRIPDMASFAPEGQIIVDWEPFRLQRSNYEYITKYSTVFASYDPHSSSRVIAFSFGTYVKVKLGMRHRLDFYCRGNDKGSSSVLLSHICNHIEMLSKHKFEQTINFSMLLPQNMDQTYVRRVLVNDLSLGPLATQGISTNDALLLEKAEHEQPNQSKL